MKFLTRDAASLFLSSSKSAYLFGIISWSQLMDRFVALREMCSPTDPAAVTADRILRIEAWESGDEWQYEGESPSNRHQGDDRPSSFGSTLDYLPDEDEGRAFLRFFAGTHTGLSNWEFHQ